MPGIFFWCLFGIYGFDPQCPGTQVTLLSPAHGDCERAGDPGCGTPGKATIIPLKPLIWESWPVPGGIVVISHGKALVLLPTQTPAGRAGPAAGSAPHPGDNEHPVVTKPRQELHPHPTSPLTCCAIPGHSQPPSTHKSSPTAPVIPVLPTHALLPGLLRPNLPWQLLSRKKKFKKIKKDASDNSQQKCTWGAGLGASLPCHQSFPFPPPASFPWHPKGHRGARSPLASLNLGSSVLALPPGSHNR